MTADTTQHHTWDNHCYLTADVVALTVHDNTAHILLIRRPTDSDAYRDHLALPAGFVERHESIKQAAVRELAEETGIQVNIEDLVWVGVFDDPGRDHRDRIVSHAYAVVLDHPIHPTPGGDAAEAHWTPVRAVLAHDELAFDHADIIRAALRRVGHRLDREG